MKPYNIFLYDNRLISSQGRPKEFNKNSSSNKMNLQSVSRIMALKCQQGKPKLLYKSFNNPTAYLLRYKLIHLNLYYQQLDLTKTEQNDTK